LLSGNEGDAVEKVKAFAARLALVTEIPMIFIDERLSTVDAQRKLHDSGKSAKDSKVLIDSMSAVGILESGLAREN
jgi:putative Holliday junction resolvase